MPKKKLWSAEQVEEMITLHKQGLNAKKIGMKFGVSWQTIRRTFNEYGIDYNTFLYRTDPKLFKDFPIYWEMGYPYHIIAQKLEVDYNVVLKYVRKHNIKRHENYYRRLTVNKIIGNISSTHMYRNKKFDSTITADDLWPFPEYCPALGYKLHYKQKHHKGKRLPNLASIDRIDSNLGYIRGNIHIISWRANSMKRDGTFDELIKLGEWAQKQKQSELILAY